MVYDYHALLAGTTIAIGVIACWLYFRDIFRGTTKPHVFTWLTYGIIDSVVVVAQLARGAGVGSWALLFSLTVCFIIAGLSLRFGEKHITRSDWLCLIGAFVAIALWLVTNDPLNAVLIAVVINILGIVPTFRKSYVRPWEESLSMWSLDALKYTVSIFALESFNLTTALFPAGIVLTNGALIAMLLLRRRQLGIVART